MDQIHQFKYVILGDRKILLSHNSVKMRTHVLLEVILSGNRLSRASWHKRTARCDNEEAAQYLKHARSNERSTMIKPGEGPRS